MLNVVIVIPGRFGGLLLLLLCFGFPWSLKAGEGRRLQTLINLLKEEQIPFEERPLFAEYGGFGTSVHVALPPSPETGRDAILVLGIPLSSEEPGFYPENDTMELPFGVYLGIEFIRHIRNYGATIPIRVAFLGDEVSQLPKDMRSLSHLGLEDLYRELDNPEQTLLVYLDIAKAPVSLVIHHGGGKRIAALTVLKSLMRIGESREIPYRLGVSFNELYWLNLVEGPDVVSRTLTRGIQALSIQGSQAEYEPLPWGTGKAPPGYATDLSVERLAAALVEYAEILEVSMGNLDYHYIIFHYFGRYWFVSEGLTVLFFMLLMGMLLFAFLIYSIVSRNVLVEQWRVFQRWGWIPLIMLSFLVIALEAAGSVIALVSAHYNLPTLSDYGRAGFKLALALLFLSALFPLLDLVSIPGKSLLYGATAVILVSLGVFIAAGLNITFTPVFMWVLAFTFLGAVIPWAPAVYLCALITPLRGVELLFLLLRNDALRLPFSSGRLTALFLDEHGLISLYLAIIMLPFMLILERGATLGKPRQRFPFFLSRLLFSVVLLGGAFGALVVCTQWWGPRVAAPPMRRTLIEPEETPPSGEIVRIQTRSLPFLERQTLGITLEARGSPQCFALSLEPEAGILPVIYAADMPFEINHEQNSIAFILGEGPPRRFFTEIVLPRDFSGWLRVEARYTAWDPDLDPLPPPAHRDYVLQVIKRVPLTGLGSSRTTY
ncbi:MAG: hypothetical protein LBD74_06565 [Spirochaetaceae bacterium]|nr:hypothetical protein [Spirochaetaceae bacterium]